jgi:hypothetical protein
MWAPGFRTTGGTINGAAVIAGQAASATNTTFWSSAVNFSGNIHYEQTNSPSVTFNPSPASYKVGADYIDTFRYADNSSSSASVTTPFYTDADGVQRAGDAWWQSSTANTLPMQGPTTNYRPVMLDRNFESVGELGYVYRDMPWRSINLCSTNTADAGVLDFFCLNDGYAGMTNLPVVAGVLDLNTPHPEVLQAMLSGAARSQLATVPDVTSGPTGQATAIADAVTNITTVQPLLNKAEIATRLAAANIDPGVTPSSPLTETKESRETVVRALASAGQVRTWNLMIDVIAQTGHLPPGATGFQNFIVTAEQRYWAHVAIDRYTGQVVSLQLEPVSE